MKHFPHRLLLVAALWAVLGWLAVSGAGSSLIADEEAPEAAVGAADQQNSPDQGETAPPADSPDRATAQKLLADARTRLNDEYQSVQARMVEKIQIGDRQMHAEGTYLQGPSLKLRLELTVEAGTYQGKLLEVCDGQVLHSQQTIGETDYLIRRNVREILKAAQESGLAGTGDARVDLGLGGLPALLGSIQQSIAFETVDRQTHDGTKFIVLEGGWSDEWQQRLMGGAQGRQLKEHLPDRIRIYLDEERLFPQRIVYLKQRGEDQKLRPLMTLYFTEIVLNAEIDESQFEYVGPDGLFPQDQTPQYIQQLLGQPQAPPQQ